MLRRIVVVALLGGLIAGCIGIVVFYLGMGLRSSGDAFGDALKAVIEIAVVSAILIIAVMSLCGKVVLRRPSKYDRILLICTFLAAGLASVGFIGLVVLAVHEFL